MRPGRGRGLPRGLPIRPEPDWFAGPGEAHRYGEAPVPYGPGHTYDYHMGDRFGYGPDFYSGDARVRRGQPPGYGYGRARRRRHR